MVDWAAMLELGAMPLAATLAGALVAALVVLLVRLCLRKAYPPSEKAPSAGLLEVVVEEHAAVSAKDSPLDVRALEIERPIGSGGQGGVWLALDPKSGKRCALKQLHKGRLSSLKKVSNVKPEHCQWLVEREALLKCGNHPFITTCLATFQDDHSLFYALELASGGDLFSRLHTSELGQLPETQCRFYTACVGLALKHIHAMGFLYCDIKLENVLITSNGYVKLCDFGLAKKIVPSTGCFGLCCVEGRSFSKCGTDQYAPPEVVAGVGRAKGSDWWALGVLLHEMLTGHSPFEGKGMAEIFARVEEYAAGGSETSAQLRAEVMEDAPELSEAGVDFLLGLLTPRERRRIGCGRGGFAASVQAHAWFEGLDWVALLRHELPAPWVPPSVTATDRKGSHAPTADEIRDEVAALFNPKTGVLRERTFDASMWQHLFAPFGDTLPRVIKSPEPLPSADGASVTSTNNEAEPWQTVVTDASSASAPNATANERASSTAGDDQSTDSVSVASVDRVSAHGKDNQEGAPGSAGAEVVEPAQLRSLSLPRGSSADSEPRV